MTPTPPKIRIALPELATAGTELEIKTLISHPMESGFRRDQRGESIPRNILTRFECYYHQGQLQGPFESSPERLVFACDLHPGIAANPFISFHARATASGTFEFRWTNQHGDTFTETRALQVSD